MIKDEREFRLAHERGLRDAGAFVAYTGGGVGGRQGIPDLYWQHDRTTGGWQELKWIARLPARDDAGCLGHRLTGPQGLWLTEVCDRGGLGLVVVGCGQLTAVFWPWELDERGQLSLAAWTRCRRKCPVGDGRSFTDIAGRMAREDHNGPQTKHQLAFWPAGRR